MRHKLLDFTTQEALNACLTENASVFCIENPLYSQIKNELSGNEIFRDYQIDIVPEKQIILMRKRIEPNQFDFDRYEIFYLPLQWDGWNS